MLSPLSPVFHGRPPSRLVGMCLCRSAPFCQTPRRVFRVIVQYLAAWVAAHDWLHGRTPSLTRPALSPGVGGASRPRARPVVDGSAITSSGRLLFRPALVYACIMEAGVQASMKWTTDDIPALGGKVAVVTGANSGVGYQMARELARKGASVVLACRDEQKGKRAMARIRAEQPGAALGAGARGPIRSGNGCAASRIASHKRIPP